MRSISFPSRFSLFIRRNSQKIHGFLFLVQSFLYIFFFWKISPIFLFYLVFNIFCKNEKFNYFYLLIFYLNVSGKMGKKLYEWNPFVTLYLIKCFEYFFFASIWQNARPFFFRLCLRPWKWLFTFNAFYIWECVRVSDNLAYVKMIVFFWPSNSVFTKNSRIQFLYSESKREAQKSRDKFFG